MEYFKLNPQISNEEGKIYFQEENNEKFIVKTIPNIRPVIADGKKYTIESLIKYKNDIFFDEIIYPTKLCPTNMFSFSYQMPFIKGENLSLILDNPNINVERKIYLLQLYGQLLEKMKQNRSKSNIEFFINDIHADNVIVSDDDSIHLCDIDSCKIINNLTFPAKYLCSSKNFKYDFKYPAILSWGGGIYKVNDNTEIYSYIAMIMEYLLARDLSIFEEKEYFNYINYLQKLGLSEKLANIFKAIYLPMPNENPSKYLEDLLNIKEDTSFDMYIRKLNHY